MTHVDYLCPICQARIGVARFGAYCDPLELVRCESCHRTYRFHDVIKCPENTLLRGVAPGPPAVLGPIIGHGTFAVDDQTSQFDTPPITVRQNATLVITLFGYSPGADLITWGATPATDLNPESFSTVQVVVIPDLTAGTFPVSITKANRIFFGMIVSEIQTTPPGSDPRDNGVPGDPTARFNDGGGTGGSVSSTSHVSKPMLFGAYFSPGDSQIQILNPPFAIGQQLAYPDPNLPNAVGYLAEYYSQQTGPANHTATISFSGATNWDLAMTVLNMP